MIKLRPWRRPHRQPDRGFRARIVLAFLDVPGPEIQQAKTVVRAADARLLGLDHIVDGRDMFRQMVAEINALRVLRTGANHLWPARADVNWRWRLGHPGRVVILHLVHLTLVGHGFAGGRGFDNLHALARSAHPANRRQAHRSRRATVAGADSDLGPPTRNFIQGQQCIRHFQRVEFVRRDRDRTHPNRFGRARRLGHIDERVPGIVHIRRPDTLHAKGFGQPCQLRDSQVRIIGL